MEAKTWNTSTDQPLRRAAEITEMYAIQEPQKREYKAPETTASIRDTYTTREELQNIQADLESGNFDNISPEDMQELLALAGVNKKPTYKQQVKKYWWVLLLLLAAIYFLIRKK